MTLSSSLRAADSLREFIGDVKMIPGEKYGQLIAEARVDGGALMRKCKATNKGGSRGPLLNWKSMKRKDIRIR